MKIFYHTSQYVSHRRAAMAYMACLAGLGHELVRDPVSADLIVLHDEPVHYERLKALYAPRPGVRIVGYAVWETPQLPIPYVRGVRAVDAVWTASEFSRAAFAPFVPAFVLPHVAERMPPSSKDLAWARRRTGLESMSGHGPVLLYCILDTVNPRKNAATLFAAFAAAFPDPGSRVRLVVKQYRGRLNLEHMPGVIDIPEELTDGQIAALHAMCDVYVSAHHAEAWGLPLSEAMSYGNLVIATGYSGNMEFMNGANSVPVAYTLGYVSERMRDCLPELFTTDMTWAEIDPAALVQAMRRAVAHPPDRDTRQRIAESMARFSTVAVASRLAELVGQLPAGRLS